MRRRFWASLSYVRRLCRRVRLACAQTRFPPGPFPTRFSTDAAERRCRVSLAHGAIRGTEQMRAASWWGREAEGSCVRDDRGG